MCFLQLRFNTALHPPPQPYTYLPFGGGPRFCVGAAMAQVETKLVLARILRRYNFELPPQRMRFHMGATWSPPARCACACMCARQQYYLARHLPGRTGPDCAGHAAAMAAQPAPAQCCHRGYFLGHRLCTAGLDVFCAGGRLPAAPAAGGSARNNLGRAPECPHLAAQPRPPGRLSLPRLARAMGRQLCMAQPAAGVYAARRVDVADICATTTGADCHRARRIRAVGWAWHTALAGRFYF